jgi:hypothetical protein
VLTEDVRPVERRISLDVHTGNQPALEFWRAVGFLDSLITFEMERST